jgi:hypothetical protein
MHATTAHPPTQARKPKKTRTFRIVQRPTPEEVAIVAITINGVLQRYHVQEFHVAPDMGLAGYEFGKGPNDVPYHVLLCHDGKGVCDCLGHTRYRHCKHADLTPILFRLFRKA